MSSKRKFKRDYIILEAKDLNFRFKEKTVPKAFAKVEVSDEKAIVALYVENLKYVQCGYNVVAILNNYDVENLGEINVSEQGKGEFILNLDDSQIEIRAIALVHQNNIPLIGFKGIKIDNYEELILASQEEDEDEDETEEYEEIVEYEYIEIEEDEEDEEYKQVNHNHSNHSRFDKYQETDYQEPQQYQHKEQERKYKENIRENTNKTNFEDELEYRDENETKRPFLMPRQIKKGLKRFKETKPFVTERIESTRWWKIDVNPMTLCGYNMPYLGYINLLNYTMYSDASMNSYKYRHYLFGVQYDEYNNRKYYIYAIPGNREEQPDKGNTGFVEFIPCDDRNDDIGYWICMIDPRSRTIKK